jgi:predicted small lipoprotein YifL
VCRRFARLASSLRPTVALPLAALAACGGPGPAEPPPPERRVAALPPPERAPLESEAARRDRFCRALGRIIDAEGAGFASLRGRGVGGRVWEGAVVPVGLRRCEVEGDYRPGAVYVCRGQAIAGGSGDLLLGSYRDLAADVDACLRRPVWYPASWQRGQDFAFAGGERQTVWRDRTGGPSAAVALKIKEDFGSGGYFVRLAVASDR